MTSRIEEDGFKIERHTISRWIEKFKAMNLVATGKAVYYSVRVDENGERTVKKISEETYKKAWQAYFDHLKKGEDCKEGIKAMYAVAGGKCYKRLVEENNAFYKDLIDRLIETLESE